MGGCKHLYIELELFYESFSRIIKETEGEGRVVKGVIVIIEREMIFLLFLCGEKKGYGVFLKLAYFEKEYYW